MKAPLMPILITILWGCNHPEGNWKGTCGEETQLSITLPDNREAYPCDNDSDTAINEDTCTRRNNNLPVTGSLWWSQRPYDLLVFACPPWEKSFGTITINHCQGIWQNTTEQLVMDLNLELKHTREEKFAYLEGDCIWNGLENFAHLLQVNE